MERLNTVGRTGAVGKFRPEQIRQMSTWAGVPDGDMTMAAVTQRRIIPANGSTETVVNPLDAGDQDTNLWYDHDAGTDTFVPAAKRL